MSSFTALPEITASTATPCKLTVNDEDRIVEKALLILHSRLRKVGPERFTDPDLVKKYLSVKLLGKEREIFICLFLDTKRRLIEAKELFYGTIDSCTVHPREVLRHALRLNAQSVICGHNHVSGIADPSQADLRITRRLKAALELVDIRILDHMIVGENEVVSFAEKGLIL